jgi:hypothetical protein
VNASVSGVDINAIGVILMIVGAVGLLLSLMFWSSWGGYGVARGGGARRVTTYEEGPPPGYSAEPGSEVTRGARKRPSSSSQGATSCSRARAAVSCSSRSR